MTTFSPETPQSANRLQTTAGRVQLLVGAFMTLLLLFSRQIWRDQADFPQIPLFAGFELPGFLATTLSLILFAVSIPQATSAPFHCNRVIRAMTFAMLISGIVLILQDQHRMQPWFLHFLWINLFLLLAPRVNLSRLIVILTVTIYLGSAVSKFNSLYPAQHGQMILTGIDSLLHTSLAKGTRAQRELLCYLFPMGELLIAGLLLFSRTRRWGAVGSVLMHTLLACLFSPLGLDHEVGVVLWNVFFIAQAFLLWIIPVNEEAVSEPSQKSSRLLTVSFATLLIALPVGRMFGFVDDWLGWSLYSPRREVVRLYVTDLPEKLQKAYREFLIPAQRGLIVNESEFLFTLDRWSLETLGVPLNPSARIEYGVALALCEDYDLWSVTTIELEQRDLFDMSERQRSEYSGQEEIIDGAEQFRLNAFPNGRFKGRYTTREDQ